MLSTIFDIVIGAVATATMTVGGAACDAGTFIADTAVYVADVTCETTCDVVDTVGDFFYDLVTEEKEITFAYAVDEDGFVHPIKTEEIQVEDILVEDILTEEIQTEAILFEDCSTYWPD